MAINNDDQRPADDRSQNVQPFTQSPIIANQLIEIHQKIVAQADSEINSDARNLLKAASDEVSQEPMDEKLVSFAELLGVLEKMRRSQISGSSYLIEKSRESSTTWEPLSSKADQQIDGDNFSDLNFKALSASEKETHGEPDAKLPTDIANEIGISHQQDNDSVLDEVATNPYRGLQIGRFQVQSFVGQGGFGMVFAAYDDRLDRIVALKVPRPEALLSPDRRRRFLREGRAAAALSHPNIVGVLESGEEGPICYIASEFIDGLNLAEWLKTRGPLDNISAAVLVSTLAEAAQHAHSRQVLHRDIKPSNVLMSGDKPLLTDFGLALRLDQTSEKSIENLIAGTPAFMAPEQAINDFDGLDGRADVYGLGGILYFLLTDQPPLSADSPLATLDLVRYQEPVPPRSIRPATSRDLESICLKCLGKSPADRYHSAHELHLDLQRFLAGKPVHARPVPAWQRLHLWSRRNPVLSIVSFAAMIFLTISLIASTLGWVFTSRALRDARLANEATLAAQQESEQRFLAAKQTVDEYFTQVATNRLLNVPGMTSLRHELLQAALVYYQGFLPQAADDDELQAEIERSHFRMAEILADLGRPAEALQHFRLSERMLMHRLNPDVTNPELQQTLNQTWFKIALLQMVLGESTDAMVTLEQAIAGQQELMMEQPESVTIVSSLATFWQQKGNFLKELRQPNEAHNLFESVVELRSQLVADDVHNEDLQRELLLSQGNLSNALRGLGKIPAAQVLAEEVVAGFRKIASKPKATLADRHTLLKSLYNRSLLSMMTRNFEAARQTLVEAANLADILAQMFPAVEDHVRDPAIMRGALAVAFLELGEIDLAMENFRLNERACVQVAELNPESTNNLIDAGLAKLNYGAALGNHAKDYTAAREMIASAQEIFGQLLNRNPDSFNARLGATNCEINLAAVAVELEDWNLAVQHSQRGLELALELSQEHATNPQFRHAISQAYTNLATGHEHRARFDDAIANWQNVLSTAFPSPNPLHRLRLAAALILGGRLSEAEEQLVLVDGQLGERANLWLQQGRCFALLAGKLQQLSDSGGVDRQPVIDERSQQAITSLKRASDLGQFEIPKWHDYLRFSAELDQLRSYSKFQELLDE